MDLLSIIDHMERARIHLPGLGIIHRQHLQRRPLLQFPPTPSVKHHNKLRGNNDEQLPIRMLGEIDRQDQQGSLVSGILELDVLDAPALVGEALVRESDGVDEHSVVPGGLVRVSSPKVPDADDLEWVWVFAVKGVEGFASGVPGSVAAELGGEYLEPEFGACEPFEVLDLCD